MVINDVYNLVAFIFNKQKSGHITPTKFNVAIKAASRELFDDLYRTYEDTQYISDELRVFLKTSALTPNSTTGVIGLPSDYSHKVSIRTTTNNYPVDLVKAEQWGYRINNSLVAPTARRPVARVREDNQLEFRPLGLSFTLDYFQKDLEGIEWAYTIVSGKETFDEGSSTDVLWSSNVVNQLARRVLEQFGVSLKDTDVFSYSNQTKQTEIN